MSTSRNPLRLLATWTIVACLTGPAAADVMVVSNRTPRRVPIEILLPGTQPFRVTLPPGESRPVFNDGACQVSFSSGRETLQYSLAPGSLYFIGTRKSGELGLEQIGLGEKTAFVAGLPGSAATTPAATIPVKILVDDDEATRQLVWEPRLRKRVEAASKVLHRTAMVKLEVVAVDTWRTDDSQHDFHKTLRDFEETVDPFPAHLAIGFSSQYEATRGRVHMGGTRGALRSHILLREWSNQLTETERLELLLHELGHYLGAAHSPEADSVMRPVLGDALARRSGFVVRYDPVNTLLMSMVGEELRRRRVSHFAEVGPATRQRLQEVYEVLGYAQPKDPAARLLGGQLGRRRPGDPLVEGTRAILAHLSQAARTNKQLPSGGPGVAGPHRVEGDELFDQLVRLAASQASSLPEEVQRKAFLWAIGVGIGDPEQAARVPAISKTWRQIESPAEANIRSTYIGEVSVEGRRDLARHFTVAAMLVAAGGRDTAETLSLAKEVVDAQVGTGFSFADLAADKAGIRFGMGVLDGTISLQQLGQRFTARDYITKADNLPEGMTTMQFIDQFGGQNDERFQRMVERIEADIAGLPGYRGQP